MGHHWGFWGLLSRLVKAMKRSGEYSELQQTTPNAAPSAIEADDSNNHSFESGSDALGTKGYEEDDRRVFGNLQLKGWAESEGLGTRTLDPPENTWGGYASTISTAGEREEEVEEDDRGVRENWTTKMGPSWKCWSHALSARRVQPEDRAHPPSRRWRNLQPRDGPSQKGSVNAPPHSMSGGDTCPLSRQLKNARSGEAEGKPWNWNLSSGE
ncbi:hypothetical protein B0H16DRAFT_1698533 [Mycena metata]|uniref:Uncharacterized protein n=1 Tax=Mycena metata TaxID=1033252 RepID=A0AAD7HNS7_9AGAR|nr:hypothetical protein B0H16DRAFT_1698533 [Mycena metata]